MSKKTLANLNIAGKKVLVRVDFNVPIEQGIEAIADYDQRLRATLPTIKYLIDRECKIILCSHLGRPDGSVKEDLRLAPVGDRLSNLLGMAVLNLGDCVGPEIESAFAVAHRAHASTVGITEF